MSAVKTTEWKGALKEGVAVRRVGPPGIGGLGVVTAVDPDNGVAIVQVLFGANAGTYSLRMEGLDSVGAVPATGPCVMTKEEW